MGGLILGDLEVKIIERSGDGVCTEETEAAEGKEAFRSTLDFDIFSNEFCLTSEIDPFLSSI